MIEWPCWQLIRPMNLHPTLNLIVEIKFRAWKWDFGGLKRSIPLEDLPEILREPLKVFAGRVITTKNGVTFSVAYRHF